MEYPYRVLAIAPQALRDSIDTISYLWDSSNTTTMFPGQEWQKDGENFCVASTHGSEWFFENYWSLKNGTQTLAEFLLAHPLLAAQSEAIQEALEQTIVIFWGNGEIYPDTVGSESPRKYLDEHGYAPVN